MDIHDFFELPEVALPTARKALTHIDHLDQLFAQYIEKVKTLGPGPHDPNIQYLAKHKSQIESLAKAIREAHLLYLDGHPEKAYRKLAECLSGPLADQVDSCIDDTPVRDGLQCYYRMRKDLDDPHNLTKDEIFHIPFHLRHLVGPQRFSISGVPVLYLASSIYLCWEEMGRPPLDRTAVAAFQLLPKQQLRTLDLGIAPAIWGRHRGSGAIPDVRGATLVLWPLIAACTVRRKESSAPFQEEYIIPHLLLQWARADAGIDALSYFSVRTNPAASMSLNRNLVIPTKNSASSGYCLHTRARLNWTAPLAWRTEQLISSKAVNTASRNLNYGGIYYEGERKITYNDTHFYQIEERLRSEL